MAATVSQDADAYLAQAIVAELSHGALDATWSLFNELGWDDETDVDANMEVYSWSRGAETVSSALAASSGWWAIAAGAVVAAEQSHEPESLRELVALGAELGFVVVGLESGSLKILLSASARGRVKRFAAATLVLSSIGAALSTATGYTARDLIKGHGADGARCDIDYSHDLTEEARGVARDLLEHLPTGCSLKINLRTGSSGGLSTHMPPVDDPARRSEALDPHLSPLELEMLTLLREAHSPNEIQERLSLPGESYYKMLNLIVRKLGANDIEGALIRAIEAGFVSPA
ncbi:helix-turn-helix transcriptional regulator [Baekduia soli]|uniref:Helix-turn-helix transcriptional regulator n=1 Tax=Baekduia soli TaxID=496014 RepID=A0A5B8U9A8_9ACTN|nr:helix-turn-helix transcriptional regulator [Baekduia soli]QEC49664.1 helix-turn-helix transcriptional regulator [Baekduia soli]